jgi:TRAP-type C4-dicarboxylate transport system permease large subunit
MDIELLYFILMIGMFLVGTVVLKLPTGLSMLMAALVGGIAYAFTAPEQFLLLPRHLVDGSFGYIEPILTIASAMIFMVIIEKAGTLDAFSVTVLEKLHKRPTLLLLAFMFIIMFPGMITGSSVTSVVSSGTLVAPMMLAIGIPKKETTAIIAAGAVAGMIAPPINIPVMIICDIVDMPYIGFMLPLLILTLPLAIFYVLYLGRRHIKKIDLEAIKDQINFKIKEETSFLVYTPLIVLIILLVLVNFFPQVLPTFGTPLVFIISAIPAFFCGRKVNLFKASKEAIKVSLPVMAMLMGIGMLVQIMTLNGVRGFVVYNVMTLAQTKIGMHPILLYLGAALFVPGFGSISPLASALVFGGPIVMALLFLNPIIVASALALLASVGDFLPPSAIAGQTAARVVGVEKYVTVLPKLIVPIIVTIVYSVAYMLVLGLYY